MDFTPALLLEAGAEPELIGRFPFLVNFDPLTEASVDRIIAELVLDLESVYDVDIDMKKPYCELLHSLANTKFGCRAMKNRLQTDLLSVYTQAMRAKHEEDEVIINVTLDEKPCFFWRPFNEEEMKIVGKLQELSEANGSGSDVN